MGQTVIDRDIADDLRERVAAGEWSPGERIPSARELQAAYGVGQTAVSRAIDALRAEGMLVSNPAAPRRGVRVRSMPQLVRDLRMFFKRPPELQGLTFESEFALTDSDVDVEYRWGPADDEEKGSMLELSEQPLLLRRTYRFAIEGTPHKVAYSYLPSDLALAAGMSKHTDEVPGKASHTWLKEAGVTVTSSRVSLEARLPLKHEQEALAITTPYLPVLVTKAALYSGETPVETTTTIFVANQIRFEATEQWV